MPSALLVYLAVYCSESFVKPVDSMSSTRQLLASSNVDCNLPPYPKPSHLHQLIANTFQLSSPFGEWGPPQFLLLMCGSRRTPQQRAYLKGIFDSFWEIFQILIYRLFFLCCEVSVIFHDNLKWDIYCGFIWFFFPDALLILCISNPKCKLAHFSK